MTGDPDADVDRREDMSTSKRTVFGTVDRGTVCRVCGNDVDDGRSSYCSDRCRDLADAVMRLLNWGSYKELIKGRDGYTCQECGADRTRRRRAIQQTQERVEELVSPLRTPLGEYDPRFTRVRLEFQDRYNVSEIRGDVPQLQVDHVDRVADGGPLFDESNLQTLCRECHAAKTARENSNWDRSNMDFETRTLQDFIDHGEVEQ